MTAKDVILARKLGGGGGGTEITDGIVVKARDADGYATVVDLYNEDNIVHEDIRGNFDGKDTHWVRLNTVNLKFIPQSFTTALCGLKNLQTLTAPIENPFENITEIASNFMNYCAIAGDLYFPNLVTRGTYCFYNLPNITKLSCPKITSAHQYFCYGCARLKELYLPRVTLVAGDARDALGNNPSLEIAQIGSVGVTVTSIRNNAFNLCAQTGLTVTVYTNGTYADTLLANVRNGATNATIIIKASEDTTYNDVSYAAGETMITSTVEATT